MFVTVWCYAVNFSLWDIFSLTKDMTGKEDVYRGPAIRALCRITDVSVLQLPVSYYCDYYFLFNVGTP